MGNDTKQKTKDMTEVTSLKPELLPNTYWEGCSAAMTGNNNHKE